MSLFKKCRKTISKVDSVVEDKLEVADKIGPLEIYGIEFKRGYGSYFKLMGRSKDGHWLEFCSLGYSGRESLEFAKTTDYVEQILEAK